jgi:membrane associated rhomboid family serine protease
MLVQVERLTYCVRVRRVASLRDLPQYPVVAGTGLLAIAVTIAWWSKVSISPLFATAMIRRGELWRLVTCILPHGDILHLAFNIYWLWVFGSVIEREFGHLKTAALILLLAVGSGSLEFAFSLGGIGLSGVGYGLFGLLWVLSSRDERFRDAVDARTVQVFVVWFFLCIFTTATKMFQVANIAHGVGAVLGILIGFALTRPEQRNIAIAAVVAIVGFGLWGSTLGRPKINLSDAGYEEGRWGYEALMADHNKDALRWLQDAVQYQPKSSAYWYNLGIARERVGDMTGAQTAYHRAHDLEPANAEYSEALDSGSDSGK